MRKRAGTGLSAFLTKLMRTETTVVELPTLTINTTTIEEAAVPADSDEDDDDEEDEDDDGEEVYDSDAEDEGEDVEGVEDVREHKDQRGATPANKETADENRVNATPPQQTLHPNAELDSVVVLDRSIPSPSPLLINAAETRQAQTTASTATQDAVHSAICKDDGTEADPSTSAEPHISPRPSISSSLSSSWDHITRRDLEKQVTILPSPVTTSKRRSPYGRRGLHGVRSSTGRAAKSASTAAQRLGWQLSTFLSKFIRGIGSNSSTFNTTKATPRTSPLAERSSFQPQVPAIATEISGVDDRTGDQDGSRIDTLKNGSLSASTSIAQFQGEPLHSNANMAGPSTNARGITLSMEGSSLQPPRPCITPATSLMTNPTAFSTPVSSPAPSTSAPRFTGSSPAAVAVSAAAAAFYLPLECRQRIHTQVQEEGRANAPYLFGPAKGFVVDVVLLDHYYPLFLKHVELQNLGLLTRHHPSNVIKQRGMVWIGVAFWLGVIGIQLALILMGMGGWKSPWVWLVGVVGGWTGSICLATGIKGFSPILGILGKMCEDRHLFRFRRIQEPSIRVRHRWRAYWMLSYCIFWSTVVMVVFAALPQRNADR
ncbi:hypothetical protein BC939DRAFT_452459 [Gamsiella multidivaricata]|uniref:uncharacterized protein n=1 Tax=Gamsiella multidivaricata TaxID=101098 RepID=UPI00221EC1D4|nr:uncharacterized protein BC939DRAFT_452459 [Gamsiella multidivaricata]KAI7822990.1 hypothetical protein BC939DRAFT_452459 [Gamsiella multidivaricata]